MTDRAERLTCDPSGAVYYLRAIVGEYGDGLSCLMRCTTSLLAFHDSFVALPKTDAASVNYTDCGYCGMHYSLLSVPSG